MYLKFHIDMIESDKMFIQDKRPPSKIVSICFSSHEVDLEIN